MGIRGNTHLQSETRPDLLELDLLAIVVKDIAMVSDENKITLIVESDDSPSDEFRLLWDKRSEETRNCVTKSRRKIVHDHL